MMCLPAKEDLMYDVQKSLVIKTWGHVLDDNSTYNTARDIATFTRRYDKQFLTKELPSLGKAVEESLVSMFLISKNYVSNVVGVPVYRYSFTMYSSKYILKMDTYDLIVTYHMV